MINFCVGETLNETNPNGAMRNLDLTRFFPDQKKWQNLDKVPFNLYQSRSVKFRFHSNIVHIRLNNFRLMDQCSVSLPTV